jgi:hypothetical protein
LRVEGAGAIPRRLLPARPPRQSARAFLLHAASGLESQTLCGRFAPSRAGKASQTERRQTVTEQTEEQTTDSPLPATIWTALRRRIWETPWLPRLRCPLPPRFCVNAVHGIPCRGMSSDDSISSHHALFRVSFKVCPHSPLYFQYSSAFMFHFAVLGRPRPHRVGSFLIPLHCHLLPPPCLHFF